MNNKLLSSLEKIADKEINSLKKIIIFPEGDNSYTLYDRYYVEKNSVGTYTASVLYTHTEKTFYKLRHAMAWCSFDKRQLYKQAHRLHELDGLVWAMDTEIQLHLSLIKRSKDDSAKLIYVSKLTQNRSKKRQYSKELNTYVALFDRYQHDLFNGKPSY